VLTAFHGQFEANFKKDLYSFGEKMQNILSAILIYNPPYRHAKCEYTCSVPSFRSYLQMYFFNITVFISFRYLCKMVCFGDENASACMLH